MLLCDVKDGMSKLFFHNTYFTGSQSEIFIIINHCLLIFEYYIIKSRSNKHLSFSQLKKDIIKVKTLEEDLRNGDNNKSKKYHKNWQKISHSFVSLKKVP